MNFKGIEICCPKCKGEFRSNGKYGDKLICLECDSRYPVIAGIPDLRVFPDPYIGFEADREKGLKVSAYLEDLDFTELVAYYYSITTVVPPHHAKMYTRGLKAAAARSAAALDTWTSIGNNGNSVSDKVFLDLGCGTAPLMLAANRIYRKVVGVDIAFRWLVIARKRLQETGVDAPLICACAEALPFPDDQFDVIASESVLEHVTDQRKTFAECYRCARSEAWLFLSTPNRFSLGPDPQVGILAGGYLPDRVIAAIVRRQGGIPPQRHLLSVKQLRKLILDAGFNNLRIFLPDIPNEQKVQFPKTIQLVIDIYHGVKSLPVSRQFLFWIGPIFYAVARVPKEQIE